MPKDDKRTLTPRLRFPEFRKEKGWEVHPIGNYLTESRIPGSNGRIARKLTVKLWGKGVTEKAEVLRGSENTHYYRRSAGQFIYSKLDFLNQAFGIVPASLDGYESTVDLPCFDVADSLNSKFLLEYVQRGCFYKKNGELADGGRKAKRIQVESFLSFPIAIPAIIAEQQKIADCLTSLDEVIAAQGRRVEALKAHKKGLMQQLFPREGETTPRLRFPEFRNKGEWRTAALGELLAGKPEYGVNAAAVPFSDSLPAYLRITDIDDDGRYIPTGKVSVDIDTTEENYLSDGDIALARTGASVGKSYRYRPEDGRLVFAGFLIRIRPDKKKVVPALLSNFLTTQRYWDWVRVTSARSGQPGINGTEYATLLVPIPLPTDGKDVLAEQQRIADCLSALDARIAAEADKLAALKAHKKGLMQQLFPSPEGE